MARKEDSAGPRRGRPKKAPPKESKIEPIAPSELPTPQRVRRAHKADLVAWCEQLGLDSSGRVVDLRKRLLAKLEGLEGLPSAPPKEEGVPELEAEPEEPRIARKVPKEAEAEDEEPAFAAKQKPKGIQEIRRLLRLRAAVSERRPTFRRQEWYRYQRLGVAWRRPRGHHSKMRRGRGSRINRVSVGYRGPVASRGLHPSGYREVLVHNVHDLGRIDSEIQAARIAHGVGSRKRSAIEAAAREKGIRVLNRMEESA